MSAAAVTKASRFQKVRRKWITIKTQDGKQQASKRLLIVGLGESGESALRMSVSAVATEKYVIHSDGGSE